MRLILEGPDNAGKTTLARKLCDELGAALIYFHPGGKPADQVAEFECMQEQFNKLRDNSNILMDRITPISQRIYNPDPVADHYRAEALTRMMVFAPVIVYCRPSTDLLLRVQDFKWRPGETEEHKQKIIDGQHTFVLRYDDLMRKIPHIDYDWEHELAPMQYTTILQGLMGRRDMEAKLHTLMNLRGM